MDLRGFGAGFAFGALVACGGSSPYPVPVPSHSDSTAVARSTPAPSIAWAEHAFATNLLPAIARGGEVALVAIRESDAGRGWPNLRLDVRDRNDRTIQTIKVMDSNDHDTLFVDDRPGPELQDRIAAANSELGRLHGLHDLIAMDPLEIQKPAGDALPHLAIGDGLDIDWASPHLKVFRHNGDRPFRIVDGAQWLAPHGTRCAQCPPCDNPAFLHAAYKAKNISAIVVEIGYRGTDTCPEPGNQLHLITW